MSTVLFYSYSTFQTWRSENARDEGNAEKVRKNLDKKNFTLSAEKRKERWEWKEENVEEMKELKYLRHVL